jgi:hypothetical protein
VRTCKSARAPHLYIVYMVFAQFTQPGPEVSGKSVAFANALRPHLEDVILLDSGESRCEA